MRSGIYLPFELGTLSPALLPPSSARGTGTVRPPLRLSRGGDSEEHVTRALLSVVALIAAAACTPSQQSPRSPAAVQRVAESIPPTVDAEPPQSSPPTRRDKEGFSKCHGDFLPNSDGYPNEAGSQEVDAVLVVLHEHCFATLANDHLILSGGRLIVHAVAWPTADARSQRLFFFEQGLLVGTDTSGDYTPSIGRVRLTARNQFSVSYDGVGPNGGPACCPANELTVRFQWLPGRAPRALDRMPSYSYPK